MYSFRSYLFILMLLLQMLPDLLRANTAGFLQPCLDAMANGSATLDSPAIIQCTRAQSSSPLNYFTSDGSPTQLRNCAFLGCSNIVASTPLLLYNVLFHKSAYAGKSSPSTTGGAISLINTTATLFNVTFEGCGFVSNGGAIFVDSNSSVNISNSNFTSQSRVAFGSAIYFQSSSSSSIITNTLFLSNGGGLSQSGGAIYFQSSSSCIITNSSFILNSAFNRGGALLLDSNSTVWVSSSSFSGNIAGNGGSIYQSSGSLLTIDSSIFNASVGGDSGGAIYTQSGNLTASNTLFFNCTALYQASSIYMTSGASTLLSNVSVTGGYLTGGLTSNLLPLTQSVDFTVTNHSSLVWNGGQSLGFSNGSNPLPIASGGMLSASAGAVVVLSNLNISGQYVSGNGGVLFASDPLTSISITNSSFSNISCSAGSGAILYSTSSATSSFSNISFANISSSSDGGAIYAKSKSISTLYNVSMNGIQSRGNGGAIFADSSTISIQGMSSLNSFAYGPHGGFIAAQSGSSIRCSWCLVNNSGFLGISSFNSSDGYGQGGAFFMFKSSLTLLYTNITNSSANFGGAVYLNVDCPSIFNYTNFIGNTALFGGGAIGIRNSISTYSNVLFANNNALVQGGAMTLELWNGTIYRASFTGPVSFINNNVLDQTIGYGGAISMDTQSTLEINTTQLVITGNKAVFGSAILCSNYFFGVAYGLITYNPPPSEVQSGLYPKIQGIIFFSQKSFAYYMSQNNPFKGIPDIILDSEPITLQFPSNNISAKTITLPNITDVVIPPVQIQLSNAFGLPIQTINLTNPYIVKLELNSSDGSPLLRTYKGVLRPGLPVEFHNISLENQIISKGKLIYTFSYDYSDPLHSYTVNFNTNNQNYDDGYKNLTAINEVNAALAQLSTGSSQAQMIIPHCSENGTIVQLIGYNNNNSLPIYKCVPILKTSQSAQIITGSLSGIFAILTIALGIYAYRNKEVKVYKVKSSFFTTIITIGCLIQLISVIFQSLVTSTSLPCMTVQWFELCGFMMVCVSLGLKTYRIRMIFLDPWSTVGKQYILKNNVLGSGVALGVAAAIVLLIAWTVVENIQLNTIYISKDAALFGYQYGWVQTDRCISNRGTAVFPLVSAAIHVVAEIILVYVAFTARKVMPLFNESRLIFTVSFFWLICTTLFVAIEMFVPLVPDALIAVQAVRIFLPVALTVLLMHIPNAATIILDPLGPLVNFGGFFSSKTGFTSTNNSNNNSKLVSKGSAAPSGYVQSGKMGTLNKSSSAHSSQISLASLKKIDEHNSRDLLIPS